MVRLSPLQIFLNSRPIKRRIRSSYMWKRFSTMDRPGASRICAISCSKMARRPIRVSPHEHQSTRCKWLHRTPIKVKNKKRFLNFLNNHKLWKGSVSIDTRFYRLIKNWSLFKAKNSNGSSIIHGVDLNVICADPIREIYENNETGNNNTIDGKSITFSQ